MKKPELEITQRINGIPVEGRCSACPGFMFHSEGTVGKSGDHEQRLKDMFAEHFKNVHMREDASQAAARVVREATEKD
jgi:hypothetical protein